MYYKFFKIKVALRPFFGAIFDVSIVIKTTNNMYRHVNKQQKMGENSDFGYDKILH